MERLLNLELTSYCDANCSMCPRDNVCEFGYISMETIDNLIKKVENYALFEISLSGRGESTFHPELIKILKKLRELKTRLSIVTTTDGLNKDNYKDCMDNVDMLRVSVSSIDRETFHKIHRGLDYDKIWDNIQMLVDYDPSKLNIHLVGGEETYPKLEDTIRYFKEHGVDNIHLFPLWNRGGNIREQEINELRKYLVNRYNIFYSEDEYLDEEKAKLFGNPKYCPLGDTSIAVNFKGDMIGCFQDFENITRICNVSDDVDFIRVRAKVLKRMPVCQMCNSAKMARRN